MSAVAVNALTGVLDAGRKNMDLIGVVMVGAATALGGGTVRDVWGCRRGLRRGREWRACWACAYWR